MVKTIIVVGVQWGDEGKGKIVDLLSEKADYIVRSQGGNNAGHTIMVGASEYKFHLIPSGVLYPHVHGYVTGGTVIDPSVLVKEIEELESKGIKLRNRLKISPLAHVIMPYHRVLDSLYEMEKGPLAIGTTGKGIGPCYADKASRIGIQLGLLVRKDMFSLQLKTVLAAKNKEISKLFGESELSFDEIYNEYLAYGEKIAPYLSDDTESELAVHIDKKKKVLFEGAHGTFLDLTYGTYPYVTSSSCVAAGVAAGAGIGPTKIDHVLAVVKAYTTRVGNGPLPSALSEEDAKLFLDNKTAREVGTTTGRNRRMGWFDAVLVRHAIRLNGVDSMAIMKLDILDSLAEIKVCTGYKRQGRMLDYPPALTEDWKDIEPVYEVLPGWKSSTSSITEFSALPDRAKKYLARLEELCECPISIVSMGPERHKTLYLKPLFT